MAATLTWKTGKFDPFTRDQASNFKKLAWAFLGVGTAAQAATAQAELLGQPDFKAEVQATTDTSNVQAIDLTDEGVTFPARTVREIRGKSWLLTDNDTYFYEWTESVLGGTTPVLLGQKMITGWSEQNGTPFDLGRVHFAATITALTTITTIFASKGLALSDIANGVADLVVPQNRLILNKGCTLDATIVSATAAGNLVFINYTNLDGLGAGTAAVQFVAMDAATTDALTDDPKVGTRLDLAFEIWPPQNHRLVMNSNNVEVQVTAVNANINDDNLKHYVEIFVGPARVIGYSAV
jgi:hypothetical protein